MTKGINHYLNYFINSVANATGIYYIFNMELNQVLDLQLTQEEVDMINYPRAKYP